MNNEETALKYFEEEQARSGPADCKIKVEQINNTTTRVKLMVVRDGVRTGLSLRLHQPGIFYWDAERVAKKAFRAMNKQLELRNE